MPSLTGPLGSLLCRLREGIWQGVLEVSTLHDGAYRTWVRDATMVGWVYSKPLARVKVDVLSDVFHIRNGTWQGCPLSPLIFIRILEPFLRTIKDHTDIKGITTKSCQHKVAVYADDLIFFITSTCLTPFLAFRTPSVWSTYQLQN